MDQREVNVSIALHGTAGTVQRVVAKVDSDHATARSDAFRGNKAL
jgi:hypothetical protein